MSMSRKPISHDESKKDLDDIIDELQTRFGEGVIMKLGGGVAKKIDVIKTGSPSLDIALGVGGIPRGRIVEIYGPEASGKTTLALHIIAQAQKTRGKAAFVDAEHALDPEYAERIGVDTKEILISQPDTGEQALQIVETLTRSGKIDVIVVDSVAALVPQVEIEGEIGDQHIGLQARLMSQALRKLVSLASKSNTIIIFINQIRMQIGIMFGNPETTPGGKALKFYSSVRIEIRRTAQIKRGEDIIGNKVKVKVVKNKVAPPFKTTEFDIMYSLGISYESDLINLGMKHGIITKSGNTLMFKETKLGVGIENAKDFLKANPDVSSQILKEIEKIISTSVN